jgi:hypothetical protein
MEAQPARSSHSCSIDADRLGKLAQDSFHVGVGFAVLAFQRLQVARREFEAAVQQRLADA